MKTIKQIADELGVDKQKVYRFATKNHITASSEVMQSKQYDEAAEMLIKSSFNHIDTSEKRSGEAHHEAVKRSGSDMVIETLIQQLQIKDEQLAIKDKQIDDMSARLAETTAALVSAQQTAQAAQALHAGTIQQQLESGAVTVKAEETPKKPEIITDWRKFSRWERLQQFFKGE
jgi:hypothetical protein